MLVHGAASENVLLNLTVQGDAKPNRLAIIQEIQHHVLSNQVLHIDLHEVAENEKVVLSVPGGERGRSRGRQDRRRHAGTRSVQIEIARACPRICRKPSSWMSAIWKSARPFTSATSSRRPGLKFWATKHISVLAVAAPISEAQEAAALEAATAAVGEVEMIKEKKEEGEEGEAKPEEQGRGQAGREGRRQTGRESRRQTRRKAPAKPGEKGAASRARKPPPRRRREGRGEKRREAGTKEIILSAAQHPAAGVAGANARRMENLYLIAGLGNPGRKYAGTRHNIGFMLVAQLAARWRAAWAVESKFRSRLARTGTGWKTDYPVPAADVHERQRGGGGGRCADFTGCPPAQLLVVVDDADLPLGTIRLRAEGSSGGHHGLESVETAIGDAGVSRDCAWGSDGGKTTGGRSAIMCWAGLPAPNARSWMKFWSRAGRQVECWLDAGMRQAMNQFNGAAPAPLAKGKQ